MNIQPGSRFKFGLQSYLKATGIFIVGMGVAVLLGWAFDIPALKSLLPGWVTMKANTALAFILLGVSLWILRNEDAPLQQRRFAQVLAGIVLAIGLLTLGEYAFGWNLGIDQFVFQDPLALQTSHPGRMSPITAFFFCLLGLGILLIEFSGAQYLFIGALYLSLLALIGYVLSAESLYLLAGFVSISLPLAILTFLLSVGFLLARPGRAIVKTLTSPLPSGAAMRFMLGMGVVLIVFTHWLTEQGERLGYLDVTNEDIVDSILLIFFFSAAIYIRARVQDHAEERLRQWETIFQHAGWGVVVGNPADNTITVVNPALARMYGYTETELIGKPLAELYAPAGRAHIPEYARRANETGFVSFESIHQRKDGTTFPVLVDVTAFKDDDGKVLYRAANVRDLSERMQAEEKLSESEERFRNIFDNVPVSIWEEDFSQVKQYLDDLKANGVEDIRYYLNDHPQELFKAVGMVKIININNRTLELFEAQNKDELLGSLDKIFVPESLPVFRDELVGLADGLSRFRADASLQTLSGEALSVVIEVFIPAKGVAIDHGLVSITDITGRRQAEEALRESEQILAQAESISQAGSWEMDISTREVKWSDGMYSLLQVPRDAADKVMATTARVHPDDLERYQQAYGNILGGNAPSHFEHRIVLPDGGVRHIAAQVSAEKDVNGQIVRIIGTARDITERKQAEEEQRRHLRELEAVNIVSTALRVAQTVEDALPILLDQTLIALGCEAGEISLYDPSGDELRVAQARGWFGDLQALPIKSGEGITGTVFASGQAYRTVEFVRDPLLHPALAKQIPPGWGGACVPIRSAEKTVGVLFVSMRLPNQVSPEAMNLLASLAEMAGAAIHRLQLHEETTRRLSNLQALQQVDKAITGNIDKEVMLSTLLTQALSQLKVSAAGILLFEPSSLRLEYAAGRGFSSSAYAKSRVRLGEGLTGRVALERQIVQSSNLEAMGDDFERAGLLKEEGFETYVAAPLIAKGNILGALEVFHRASFRPDEEWLNFLETLAGQAAIAINNVRLFEDLFRSNAELFQAYDATIEGWSHALDLRDKETEGHAQRVTSMTLKLARSAGITEKELLHIQRGALLHDIGKMGVPDHILLKTGKLTDEEWVEMRKHPIFAFEMISRIGYLQPALDIPYCHHEKWDGSGYPRGLKGEQIPLAARLFAVVDVYDALISDRPYRRAWPREKALDYIREQSGSHFDPKMVELFLQLE